MAKPYSAKKSDYLLAILLGIAFACAFPPSRLDWLAWFSMAPLFKLTENKTPAASFRLGWAWGIAHFVALIYWIVVAVGHYGGMSIVASTATMGFLAFYLALYPAVFCAVVTRLRGIGFSHLWVPLTWVALEYGRAKLLTGFPWCLVGYSQHTHINLIQSASLVGVYGLSFLIILVNWAIYRALWARTRAFSSRVALGPLFAILCASAALGFGHYQIHQDAGANHHKEETLKFAVVQPSIDQSVKWDPGFQETTMDLYESLTRKAAESKPDLIIWPETATPFFFQSQNKLSKRIYRLSKEIGNPILFGSPAYRQTSTRTMYFNRAYLLRPEGGELQYYDKVHLVPFGEYVPLGRFLSFIGKLVPGAGSFTSGSSIRPLSLNGVRFGVLICFEAIFPEISREEKARGANFLVNLTNDAWFGRTSAPYQHLAMSVFRAVENGVPLVRAANTGISAVVDRTGRIHKKTGLFTKQILAGSITFTSSRSSTFYTKHGDLFAQCSVVLSILANVMGVLRRRFRNAPSMGFQRRG